jgi:hypothetical protein
MSMAEELSHMVKIKTYCYNFLLYAGLWESRWNERWKRLFV